MHGHDKTGVGEVARPVFAIAAAGNNLQLPVAKALPFRIILERKLLEMEGIREKSPEFPAAGMAGWNVVQGD